MPAVCNPDNIILYHYDELEPQRRCAVQRHLSQCPRCRELLVSLQEISDYYRQLPKPQLSSHLELRLQTTCSQALSPANRRGFRSPALLLTRIAAISLLLVFPAIWLSWTSLMSRALVELPPWNQMENEIAATRLAVIRISRRFHRPQISRSPTLDDSIEKLKQQFRYRRNRRYSSAARHWQNSIYSLQQKIRNTRRKLKSLW